MFDIRHEVMNRTIGTTAGLGKDSLVRAAAEVVKLRHDAEVQCKADNAAWKREREHARRKPKRLRQSSLLLGTWDKTLAKGLTGAEASNYQANLLRFRLDAAMTETQQELRVLQPSFSIQIDDWLPGTTSACYASGEARCPLKYEESLELLSQQSLLRDRLWADWHDRCASDRVASYWSERNTARRRFGMASSDATLPAQPVDASDALSQLESVDECIQTVFEGLSPRDLARVARVCKRWYELSCLDHAWEHICRQRFPLLVTLKEAASPSGHVDGGEQSLSWRGLVIQQEKAGIAQRVLREARDPRRENYMIGVEVRTAEASPPVYSELRCLSDSEHNLNDFELFRNEAPLPADKKDDDREDELAEEWPEHCFHVSAFLIRKSDRKRFSLGHTSGDVGPYDHEYGEGIRDAEGSGYSWSDWCLMSMAVPGLSGDSSEGLSASAFVRVALGVYYPAERQMCSAVGDYRRQQQQQQQPPPPQFDRWRVEDHVLDEIAERCGLFDDEFAPLRHDGAVTLSMVARGDDGGEGGSRPDHRLGTVTSLLRIIERPFLAHYWA